MNNQHIKNFARETYTDNHGWVENVLTRWEREKQRLRAENPNLLLCDPLYKEFSDQYGNKMFVLSMLRGYEAYLSTVKIAMN